MAGEMQITIEIRAQSPGHWEQQKGLCGEFSPQGFPRHAFGVHQQRTSVGFFDFLSDGKHRDKEDHQGEKSWNEDVGEVYIIVECRIAYGMRVHCHGLQEGHCLVVGGSFGE